MGPFCYIRMYMCTQALVTVKDRLREVEGPDMKERMQDQIRQWMIEVRSVCIVDYVGGCALWVRSVHIIRTLWVGVRTS